MLEATPSTVEATRTQGTAAEAATVFSALGLTHPVWDVGTMSGRF